jgi:hypothetical protein
VRGNGEHTKQNYEGRMAKKGSRGRSNRANRNTRAIDAVRWSETEVRIVEARYTLDPMSEEQGPREGLGGYQDTRRTGNGATGGQMLRPRTSSLHTRRVLSGTDR